MRRGTRLDYDKVLAIVEWELGEEPFKLVTSKMVTAVRYDVSKVTPRKAEKVKALV